MFKKIWIKAIDIGLDQNIPALQAKYIRLTNGIAITTPITVLSFIPNLVNFLPQTWPLLANLAASIVMYAFVLALNYFRHYSLAKVYMLFSATSNVIAASLLLGGDLNFHFFLLVVITVSYLIFDPQETNYQIFSVFFTTFSFVGLIIWNQFNPGLIELPPAFLPLSRFNNEFGLLLLLSGLVFVIFWNYRKAEIELEAEKKKSETLLFNILPVSIANQLREKEGLIADGFLNTTILFADIVGFTSLSERLEPKELVNLLNQIFSKFDKLIENGGLEKIKTIGDAYMVASGIPEQNFNHARTIANLALDMRESIFEFNKTNGQNLDIRIGINSGPVVAGVIGTKKFVYDVWGDTVNTASRMESHGLPGQIQVTEASFELLRNDFRLEERGFIEIKGKGKIRTYLLIERK